MKASSAIVISLLCMLLIFFTSAQLPVVPEFSADGVIPVALQRYLYVAAPGIRDYLGYGGHGILVFDINNNHRFVKRIATGGLHPEKTPSNVKGIAVSLR